MKRQKNGVFLVLAAAVLMSFGGLMIKAIPWNAMAVNSGRNLFAAMVTFGYMKAMGMPVRVNRTVLGCAACITACNVCYTLATRLTTAANAVVLQYTSPVFILLYLWVFFKQKPRRLDLTACCVVFAGMACCFAGSLEAGGMAGNVLAVAAASCYAVVFMVNMFPGADSFSSYFFSQVMGFAVGLPWLVTEPNLNVGSWAAIVLMGAVQVGAAYILMARGLATTAPVAANLVCMTEPVLNPVWVALFWGEKVSPASLLGIAVVLGGLLFYNLAGAKKRGENAPEPAGVK